MKKVINLYENHKKSVSCFLNNLNEKNNNIHIRQRFQYGSNT